MLGGIGVVGLVAIGVVVVAAAALAIFYFRSGKLRRRKPRSGGKSDVLADSRVEVLERTKVDAERQLVLIRCDRIEHLIMVGGPADLVVENDVKKVRGPGAATPRAAEAGQSAVAALLGEGSESRAPAPNDPGRRTAARPASAPVAGSASRPTAQPGHAGHAPEPRHQPRQEPRPQPRRTIQPTPLGGGRSEPAGRSQASAGRGNGRQEDSPGGLPSAAIPWAEPDSIENEIVQALSVDPIARGGASAPKPNPLAASKAAADPSTTLGDLADQLEEALAKEVQSASRGKPDVDASTFAFDSDGVSGAGENQRSAPPPAEPRSRPAKKDAPTKPALDSAPSPEPDRRRDAPKAGERREEAPVISLNSRRREAADPLEDEMARLLGELTGDTKGR